MLHLTLLLHLLVLLLSSAGQSSKNEQLSLADIKALLLWQSYILLRVKQIPIFVYWPLTHTCRNLFLSMIRTGSSAYSSTGAGVLAAPVETKSTYSEISMSEFHLLKNKKKRKKKRSNLWCDSTPQAVLTPFRLIPHEPGLQLGFLLIPHISHTGSQISGMYLPFSLFIARYTFVPAELTKRFW